MDGYFKQLPKKIQSHIKEVAKTVRLLEDENAIETLAQAWLEKKKMIEEQIYNLHMVETPFMGKEDKRGALILTYSGSPSLKSQCALKMLAKRNRKRGSAKPPFFLRMDL